MFPFVFVQRAPMSLDSSFKCTGAYLAFVQPVPVAERAEALAGCPAPIAGISAWGDTLLRVETASDALAYELADAYGSAALRKQPWPAPNAAVLKKFAKATEQWVVGVHARWPLRFAIGPGDMDEDDAWESDSQAKLPALLVPFLTDYAARHAGTLGDMDELSDRITGMTLACMLQYLPRKLPKALQGDASKLRKKFRLPS
jgi:hypothetical protein